MSFAPSAVADTCSAFSERARAHVTSFETQPQPRRRLRITNASYVGILWLFFSSSLSDARPLTRLAADVQYATYLIILQHSRIFRCVCARVCVIRI